MCDALRELMKDELLRAKSEGRLEGMHEKQLESLINVMKSFSVDADRAMDILRIPAAEREIYRSELP